MGGGADGMSTWWIASVTVAVILAALSGRRWLMVSACLYGCVVLWLWFAALHTV